MSDIKTFLKNQPKLTKEAQKEFNRIINVIGEDNFDPKDLSLLYDYAILFDECNKVEEEVRKEGEIIMTTNGNPYINPRANLLINKKERLARLRRDLGFTPKERQDKNTGKKGNLASLLGE